MKAIQPMRKLTPLLLLLALTLGPPAAGRPASPAPAAEAPPAAQAAASPEMAALEWLVGAWEGEAWVQMGPERRTVRQREWIEWAVAGEVLLIRGLGHSVDPESGESTPAHHALATLAWDPQRRRYSMWTYAAGRGPATPEVTVEDGKVVWGFDVPGRGRTRFTMRIEEDGRWVETGEFSADGGATWRPFLGMTLERVR